MNILKFVKDNQAEVCNIYMGEFHRQGLGLLRIYNSDDDKIKMDYQKIAQITSKELREDFNYKVMSIQGVENVEFKRKLIFNMPIIPRKALIDSIPIYLLVNYEGVDRIVQGIPQPRPFTFESESGEEVIEGVTYIFLMNPPDNKIESEWLVGRTSTGQEYLAYCEEVASDTFKLKTFRQNPTFQEINAQGPQDKEQFDRYMDLLADFLDKYYTLIDIFQENDTYGNPSTFTHDKYGEFSLDTLRYITLLKVVSEEFDYDQIKSVIEIGCGYGGLCKTLTAIRDIYDASFDKYTLVELPEVLGLAREYLNLFEIGGLEFSNGADLIEHGEDEITYDLMISEFSLCELDEEIVDKYINKITANNAYISINIFDDNKKQEFIEKLQEKYFIREIDYLPKSEWDNKILICKKL